MTVEMIPVEIIGLKIDLQPTLHALRKLGCLHIDELAESPQVSARQLVLDRETLSRQEEYSFLLAKLEGVLGVLGLSAAPESVQLTGDFLEEAHSGITKLAAQVQSLSARREELQSKLALLPRYEATLRKLLPMIPPSAHDPKNVSVGVLVSRVHIGVLDSIARRVLELTAGRADVVASDVDTSTRAMFIVFPAEFTSEVETLLGREDVSRLRLPEELSMGPPDVALQALKRQLVAIPREINSVNQELAGLAAEWRHKLAQWRAALGEELETNSVVSRFGETDKTFVIVGWVPANACDELEATLRQSIGETVLVWKLPMTPELKRSAPVALQNPKPARPFESLVRLLALPRYGHIDPTRMMAFFMPIFFGMILGDIGYGALLLIISLTLLRKYRRGVFHDVLVVLAMGSGWAIVFGLLYGELFGTLGEQLGMHALWFDRTSPENVAGLLVMTIAVGVVHITLGLLLGIWESLRDRNRGHFLERSGMLVGLIALFFIVGILAKALPAGLMTPAIVGLIIGIVLIGASLGWLGVLMGPIEFIGLIGNILSYLRIAAIGLASVYLAKVANDLAGIVGNIFVGIILAVLIHALNLVLGAFSPTIHSLRLHYVEFFRKFYEGGGKPYQPYRHEIL
jgi:V/A-type H+/Na+-transporting ATPase subunit I